jgi:hypothetical protein
MTVTAKRLNHEEITKQLEADKVATKARITQLMLEDMLDENG